MPESSLGLGTRTVPIALIESVKANTSFPWVLKSYGIETIQRGKSLFAVCPFHDLAGKPEKTPSLSIDPDKNLYHCFSCNAKGNIIQFVMEKEGTAFPEAIDKLLALKGAKIEKAAKACPEPVERGTRPALVEPKPEPLSMTEDERQTLLREVVTAATEALRNSKPGREYLENRGLDPLRLLESYCFGFWNGTQYAKLASGEKKKLATIGLLNGGTRALFENCILFPLEKEGRVSTIYGRKTVTDPSTSLGTGSGRHYMLPCKREGLYLPKGGLNPQRSVIITESIIDGLSLFAAGITNVLPLLGVNGFLPDHLEYLKTQRFPMIFIALNGDEAGNKAAAQLKTNLLAAQLPSEIITLPEGKDINDMLQEIGPGKLKEWFLSQTQRNQTNDKPTLWEDETGDTFITIENRQYRIRGLSPYGMDRLKVNVKACKESNRDAFYVDTLDLYHAKSREVFVNQTGRVLECDPGRIARDVNALITLLEEMRLKKKETEETGRKRYEMSELEKREALAYLRAPNLLDRIAADFEACGMVGNRNQNLLAYLGALSRLTDRPFGTLIVSRSGAGKSFLQDMIADMTPEESLLRMTRLTGQSLFYQGREGLKHKLLTIEEDEGMQEAMYSIRTLLSSQKLCLHGLKTDPKTGEFKAFENTVTGPASVMISTTNLSSFTFENVNRFFVLFLDESLEQTRAILDYQRQSAGLAKINLQLTRRKIEKLHRNIQRLLKPVTVVNRLGIGIEYPPEILNTRREQTKTESLIETVALLHQYQRDIQSADIAGVTMQYIEATKEDLDAVHRIAGDVLRQSMDEMPKLCRDLLVIIDDLVTIKFKAILAAKENNNLPHGSASLTIQRWQITFTRKELQEKSRWSRWHLEEHLKELEEAGYIVQRMGKKGQRYAYSLVEDQLPELPKIKQTV